MLSLVLGGTRSGKSAFALELAGRSGDPVVFLATGVAGDREMRRRIEGHRAARPPAWTTVEAPLDLAGAVPAGSGTVLLDSVDSWLGNRMEAAGGAAGGPWESRWEDLLGACDAELVELAARVSRLVAVSAEAGLSLLPLSAYGRAFGDLLGSLNQRLAARAAEVHLVVAGLPLPLHRLKAVPP